MNEGYVLVECHACNHKALTHVFTGDCSENLRCPYCGSKNIDVT